MWIKSREKKNNMKPYLNDVFISVHSQQIMTHGIISPFVYNRRNLLKQIQTLKKVKMRSRKIEKVVVRELVITRSTDLSKMSSSHVSDWGNFGIVVLYCETQFQTAAASFVGTKSREVASVGSSSALEARYLTSGISWANANHIKIFWATREMENNLIDSQNTD